MLQLARSTGLTVSATAKDLRARHLRLVWRIVLCLPAIVYVANISRWSLDLDEIYTLRDSSRPIAEILTYEKPCYYLICHLLLQLDVPDELAIRLPAALAAGALTPVCYLLICRFRGHSFAFFTSILVAANPWYFQVSQFGRFYSLMVLFSLAAILFLYGYLQTARWRRLVAAIILASLATATHTTAVTLFPAGALALLVGAWHKKGSQLFSHIKIYLLPALFLSLAGLGLIAIGVQSTFRAWIQARHGQYGNYDPTQLILGFVAFTGLQVWILAFFPIWQSPRKWSTADLFFGSLFVGSALPLVALAPLGGGVAPRYLLFSTPALFVLAGCGWRDIDAEISSGRFRWALAATILSLNIPMALSTLRDGNHCDYRAAVSFVEELAATDPIVLCTAHDLYRYYATQPTELHELHTLADWHAAPSHEGSAVQRNLIEVVETSQATGRTLLLVSREDRRQIDDDVQEWLSRHFRVLTTIETPRFDHRRNQMVVYQYCPQ